MLSKIYKRVLLTAAIAVLSLSSVFAVDMNCKGNNNSVAIKAEQLLATVNRLYSVTSPKLMKNEDNAYLWFLRGQAYTMLRRYEEGIKAFKRSIEYDPGFLKSHNNISYLLVQQHKYKEAIELSNWLIDQDKNFVEAYINKGFGLLGLKKPRAAMKEFDKAISIDRNDINAYVGKAKVYTELKEHSKAIRAYDGLLTVVGSPCHRAELEQLRKEEIRKSKQL